MYSRPGLGEAHGQQYVQSGPMFDGARPGLALSPRGHFGIQFLFSCHNSLLHRRVSSSAHLLYASFIYSTGNICCESNVSGRLFFFSQTRTTCVRRKLVENAKPCEETSIILGRRNAVIWIKLPPDGSHMKSNPSSAGGSAMGSHSCSLSRPCPWFTFPHRGEHVWFLCAPRIRSVEFTKKNIRRDYKRILSKRCLIIYEWIPSELSL